MGSLTDFTLSNARRFYSSTWKVLGFSRVKEPQTQGFSKKAERLFYLRKDKGKPVRLHLPCNKIQVF